MKKLRGIVKAYTKGNLDEFIIHKYSSFENYIKIKIKEVSESLKGGKL